MVNLVEIKEKYQRWSWIFKLAMVVYKLADLGVDTYYGVSLIKDGHEWWGVVQLCITWLPLLIAFVLLCMAI